MNYALVVDGAVVEERSYPEPVASAGIKKVNELPMLRPLVEKIQQFDPATHAAGSPQYTIYDDRVEKTCEILPLPPSPAADKLYDEAMQRDRVLRAIVQALGDGALAGGLSPAEAKAAIVARM